jgi:UDP-3-O-acyl-N-acetylglucosamine deacetylase
LAVRCVQIPILDGSGAPWVSGIIDAGIWAAVPMELAEDDVRNRWAAHMEHLSHRDPGSLHAGRAAADEAEMAAIRAAAERAGYVRKWAWRPTQPIHVARGDAFITCYPTQNREFRVSAGVEARAEIVGAQWAIWDVQVRRPATRKVLRFRTAGRWLS